MANRSSEPPACGGTLSGGTFSAELRDDHNEVVAVIRVDNEDRLHVDGTLPAHLAVLALGRDRVTLEQDPRQWRHHLVRSFQAADLRPVLVHDDGEHPDRHAGDTAALS